MSFPCRVSQPPKWILLDTPLCWPREPPPAPLDSLAQVTLTSNVPEFPNRGTLDQTRQSSHNHFTSSLRQNFLSPTLLYNCAWLVTLPQPPQCIRPSWRDSLLLGWSLLSPNTLISARELAK